MSRPQEIAQASPGTPVILAPALSAMAEEGLGSAALQGMLFSHPYEPPRGQEGAPLLALPVWYPVAARPMETLTLPQVLYRSLGSVRMPFRRTRLLLGDGERARTTYTGLLEWAVDWAESSLGASLIPVALSLRRLAGNGRSLPAPVSGCRAVLEMGLTLAGAAVEELTEAIAAGNAWILLEDDCEGGEDLGPVKRALDAVFGEAGLSHVAIVLVTAREGCDVLSDVQTLREVKKPEEPRAAEALEAGIHPLTAPLCRLLARVGSPGGKSVLTATAVLGASLLALVLQGYGELLRLFSSLSYLSGLQRADLRYWELPGLFASLGTSLAILATGTVLVYVALLAPGAAGYRWGLAYGSEEVRRSSADEAVLSMLALFSLLLLLLPRGMDPGPWKTLCIVLAALPAAVLVPLAALGALSQAGNILWLILSVRISQRLGGAGGLAALAERHRLVLHVAHFSAELPLPHGKSAGSRLPLLVAFRNREILTGLLRLFPSLAPQLQKIILTGIRKDPEPYSLAAASLVLEALMDVEDEDCRSCLQHVAAGCTAAWPKREELGWYREPSSTFRMNALEYVARRLCYLTNLEELIVVR